MTTEAILSLGSNLGDRLENLSRAREALAALPQTCLSASSRIYATEPVASSGAHAGATGSGPEFLNAVVVLATALDVHALSDAAHRIEAAMGRLRTTNPDAPRAIDIDLITVGNQCLQEPGLRLPHPRALQRRFVCEPLAELQPERVLPGQPLSVRAVLASLPEEPRVRLADRQWPNARIRT